MGRLRLLGISGVAVILLLLVLGAAAWWYLYGPNEIASEELVPANTVAFASIPNAVTLAQGFQSSQAKTLLDNPNAKPLHDAIGVLVGKKNVELLHAFLPNLSGQSFVAVTHFDYDHPEQVGLVAAMKPKAGLGDFGTFIEKLKESFPDMLKEGKTGMGQVEGVNYQWIQGPGAPDKICVAQVKGWIVTTWGEASLADWIQRYRGKSTTSSLAQNVDFRKSLDRVGDSPMAVIYLNYHAVADILQKQLAPTNPTIGNFLERKVDAVGGAALGTRFENGEIVDRLCFLIPRPEQLELGMSNDPCTFETLKFTGPDTHLYLGSSINWKQYYKKLKEQSKRPEDANPFASNLLAFLQAWVRDRQIDPQSIVDALGNEFSVQSEWTQNTTYPGIGLIVKLDHPDEFKPTLTAIVDTLRQAYTGEAVVRESGSKGQTFATLDFPKPAVFSPTIAQSGSYFGVFLTEEQATRSFQRETGTSLAQNKDFARQIGDKRQGASQVLFLDSPYILDRAYRTAMPFISIAGMMSKDVGAWMKGRQMPEDLSWLAPMGTWSCVVTPDPSGIQVYSASGIGNQGIFLVGATGGALTVLQSFGYLPNQYLPQVNASAPTMTSTTWITPGPTTPPPNSAPPDGSSPAGGPGLQGGMAATNAAPIYPRHPSRNSPSTNSDATPRPPSPAPNE